MEKIKEKIQTNENINYIRPISDKIIIKLNTILKTWNENLVISKLETLKKIAKRKYKKIETYKEKEVFIYNILNNIIQLLNQLEYNDIYNTDSIIWKNINYYSKISDIKKIVTSNTDKDKEGWDCNSQLLYFYNLIKSITNNDEFIKYRFFSDIRDNHWKLYIITKNNIYLYHRQSKHLLIHTKNIFENKKIQIEDYNEQWFIKTKNNIGLEQNKISYRYQTKYLQIKSTFYWIKLKIKSSEKEIPHIKIKWFKKLTKNIYKAFNFIYLWRKNKFKKYSYEELIEYITSKIKDKKDKELFLEVLKKSNKEKIKNIFWIKANI